MINKQTPEVNKRINLIEHAIYASYTGLKGASLSLHHILSHIIILYNEPLCISFFKKKKETYHYTFNTLKDPHYAGTFERTIKKYLTNGTNELKPINEKDYLGKLGNNEYGIIVFGISIATETKKKCLDFSPFPIEKLAPIEILLSNILKSSYAREIGITSHFNNILQDANKPRKKENKKIDKHDFDKEFLNDQYDEITCIVDKIYRDICNIPLLAHNKKLPPSLYIFIKYFDRSPARFNKIYDYSIRAVIPQTQETHIRDVLDIIKQSQRKSNKWIFNQYQIDAYLITTENSPPKSIEKAEYPDTQHAEGFWRLLKSENGIDKIINILKSPYGETSRSIIDPAIMSGVVHIRNTPFQINEVHRMHADEANKSFEESDEIKQYVCLFYLFSAMANDTFNGQIKSIWEPLRINGCPSIVIGHITSEKENEDTSWYRFFHFHNDIMVCFLRRFRIAMREKFLEQVSYIYEEEFSDKIITKDTINVNDIIEIINRKYCNLSRIYPFQTISLKLSFIEPKKDEPNMKFLWKDDVFIECDLEENIFFTKQVDITYILEEEIKLTIAYTMRKVETIALSYDK